MLSDEIERIYQQILSFERIEATSDPMRELIEDLWPELVGDFGRIRSALLSVMTAPMAGIRRPAASTAHREVDDRDSAPMVQRAAGSDHGLVPAVCRYSFQHSLTMVFFL